MGSFNVTCGLSNVPIAEGEKAGLILLKENKYREDKLPTTLITYSNNVCEPYFTPIWGIYDSYGTLKSVEKSPTTELLEDIFELSIEDILHFVARDRSIYYDNDAVVRAYGTFEPNKPFAYGATIEQTMDMLGVEKVEDNRYTFADYDIYNATATNSLAVFKDGEKKWQVSTANGALRFVEKFGSETGKWLGIKPENFGRVNELTKLGGMFIHRAVFDHLKTVKLSQWDSRGINSFKDNFALFLKEMKDPTNTLPIDFRGVGMWETLGRSTAIPSDYRADLVRYEGTEELFDLVRLMDFMTSANRLFYPTLYSSEGSDNNILEAVLEASREILDERARRYAEWEGEYDDEEDE